MQADRGGGVSAGLFDHVPKGVRAAQHAALAAPSPRKGALQAIAPPLQTPRHLRPEAHGTSTAVYRGRVPLGRATLYLVRHQAHKNHDKSWFLFGAEKDTQEPPKPLLLPPLPPLEELLSVPGPLPLSDRTLSLIKRRNEQAALEEQAAKMEKQREAQREAEDFRITQQFGGGGDGYSESTMHVAALSVRTRLGLDAPSASASPAPTAAVPPVPPVGYEASTAGNGPSPRRRRMSIPVSECAGFAAGLSSLQEAHQGIGGEPIAADSASSPHGAELPRDCAAFGGAEGHAAGASTERKHHPRMSVNYPTYNREVHAASEVDGDGASGETGVGAVVDVRERSKERTIEMLHRLQWFAPLSTKQVGSAGGSCCRGQCGRGAGCGVILGRGGGEGGESSMDVSLRRTDRGSAVTLPPRATS